MMKRILPFIIVLVCAFRTTAQNNNADMEQVRKLVLSHSAIANLYVDEVNEGKVVEAAIRAMLKELDPHSRCACLPAALL